MGVVTFGEQKSFTNRAVPSFFSDGIDGLPDYRMDESADIEEIEFFTDSEVDCYTASIVLHDAPLHFSLYPVPVSQCHLREETRSC